MTHRLGPSICMVEGCEKSQRARGWCEMHYTRWKRHGDPETRIEVSGSQRAPWPTMPAPAKGAEHHSWHGDDISYRGAHRRVQRERGQASAHMCSCGEQAAQWSFVAEPSVVH